MRSSKPTIINQDLRTNYRACIKSDMYKMQHPEVILMDQIVYRATKDAIYDAILKQGFNKLSETRRNNTGISIFDQELKGNFSEEVHQYCLLQLSKRNQLKKNSSKSSLTKKLSKFVNTLKKNNASQECLSDAQYSMPGYRLESFKECKQLMKMLQANITNKQIEFLVKQNMHQGKGVTLLTASGRQELLDKYDNGEECGKIETKDFVQEYIINPMLYKGHKFEFRFFVLLVQSSPIIMYVHTQPQAFQCIDKYDPLRFLQLSHICNPAIAKDFLAENSPAPDIIDAKNIHLSLTLKEWQKYFLQEGYIKDENWIDTYFFPLLTKRIAYFISQRTIELNDPRFYQIFALDCLMTQTFDLKILDFNLGPLLFPFTPPQKKVQAIVHRDSINLLMYYVRERYIRINQFLFKYKSKKRPVKFSQEELLDTIKLNTPKPRMFNYLHINMDEHLQSCKQFI